MHNLGFTCTGGELTGNHGVHCETPVTPVPPVRRKGARAGAGRVGWPTQRVDHQYSRNARCGYITVCSRSRIAQFRLDLTR